MSGFRLPDWLIYATGLGLCVVIPGAWREKSPVPPAPEPPSPEEFLPLAPLAPFDPSQVITVPNLSKMEHRGSAFAISSNGEWLTTREALQNCDHPALLIGGDLAVRAKAGHRDLRSQIALLTTPGGPMALPVQTEPPLKPGDRAFHPGYVRGSAGETTSRLIGKTVLDSRKRGEGNRVVYAWAEAGRTAKLPSGLRGIEGAPALNAHGAIVGVTVGHNPRRGRVYTTTTESVTTALKNRTSPEEIAVGVPLTRKNYGLVSDTLRRDMRLLPVLCLPA